MKKIVAILLGLLMLFTVTAVSADEITVILNGTELEFDVPPQIINDRTMVPMRKIFESVRTSVEWIEASRSIIAIQNANIIAMQVGSDTMNVTNILTGENKVIKLDSPPVIVDGRTLVPVRAISESLGLKVEWNDRLKTVYITGTVQG